jgi:probable HAF family extracellular repeat protein
MFRISPHAVRLCTVLAMIVALPVSVGHARSRVRPSYRVRVLPIEFPFVTGFSDRRQVIGYAPQDLTTAGFVWDAAHGSRSIPGMPIDINKHGQVAGLRRTDPASASAFLRLRSGTLVELGAFAASGLNDRGHVVGAAVSLDFESRAVVWTPETGPVDLGGSNSRALDINNKGVVVGEVQGEAAVWTDIGVWQGLGVLGDSPFGPPQSSTAYAINEHGWVVGTSTAPTGGAFLWTPDTGIENLGSLDLGADIHLSNASDISRHGTVIGLSLGWIAFAGEYEAVRPRPFVWSRRTGMLALDDLVPAGWVVTNVIAINDHDEILATASHLNAAAQTVVLEPVKMLDDRS